MTDVNRSGSNRSGHPPSAGTARTAGTLRVMAIAIIGLTLIGAAPFVLDRVHRHQCTQQLQIEVDAAYAAVRRTADRRHRTGDATLTQLLGSRRLQASSVRCAVTGEDAGLIRQRWRVDCAIRSVDVYRTSSSYARLARQLQQRGVSRRADPLILGALTTAVPPYGCGTLRAHSGESAADASLSITRLQAGRFVPTEHTGDPDYGCSSPIPVYDLPTTRVEVAYPDTAVEPEYSWVTVERETPFLSRTLGCGAAPLWCGLPLADHVLPRS